MFIKKVKFMEFPVYVVRCPLGGRAKINGNTLEFNEPFDGLAFVGGEDKEIYGVWFDENKPLTHEIICHEVYHIFFMILHALGEESHMTYEMLSAEIYTYPFGKLMRDVFKALGVPDEIPKA